MANGKRDIRLKTKLRVASAPFFSIFNIGLKPPFDRPRLEANVRMPVFTLEGAVRKPRAAIDESDEIRGDSDIAKARKRERERCEAILIHPAAKDCRELAMKLAFETKLTSNEAIAILLSSPQQSGSSGLRGYARYSSEFDVPPAGHAAFSAAKSWDKAMESSTPQTSKRRQ